MQLLGNNMILLVEDNEDDIELTIRAFKKNNIANEIMVARDGVQALKYLDGYALPSIVLLDLNLPFISGLEVLEKIRDNEKTKNLPVIILTSSAEDQDLIAGYVRGCNSFLCKPVAFKEFSEVIKTLGIYWLLLNKTMGDINIKK